MTLHPDFEPGMLARAVLPDDITLLEARNFMLAGSTLDKVSDLAGKALRIRFVDENLEDLPDTMTMGEFRALVSKHKASIIIDDKSGGLGIGRPVVPVPA